MNKCSKLILIAIASLPLISQAQVTSETTRTTTDREYNREASKFLIKIGPGFSMLDTKNRDDSGQENRPGLFLGAEIDMPMSSYFSVLTGLNYAQKGMKGSSNVGGVAVDSTLSLNYIELPLLAKINIPIGSAATFALKAGGYGAVAVSRNASITGSAGNGSVTGDRDVSDQYSDFDAGARFGADFEVPFSNTMAFLIGADYDLGLVNINKADNSPTTQTRSLMANVGLGFQL